MSDREKVKNDLRYLVGFGSASQLPNVKEIASSALVLIEEQEQMYYTLELDWKQLRKMLKEQEAVVPGADSGMCEICSFYERAMSVKPHYNARTNWYECGACHCSITSGMHCKGELIPAYKVGFCAKCGKAVMWE